MEPNVSVIIVSWNTRRLLRSCLLSLQHAAAARRAEVLLVDNASSDGTVEMVRAEFPKVDVLASERNLGFAAANNLAIPSARGRYILFLNPDTEVASEPIESMARYLDRHPDVAVAGTTILNPDGTLQPSCHPYYRFAHSLVHNRLVDRVTDRWKVPVAHRAGRPADVEWMFGACLLVRKTALEAIGGFDPDFFVYGEEIDLQFRIRKAGWRVVYVPSSGILHHGGQSARNAPLAASFHEYRGRWLFVRKHYPPISAGAYLAKTLASLAVWLGYWGTKAVIGGGDEAVAQLRAYRQLLIWHVCDRGLPPAPVTGPALRREELAS